MEVPANLVDAGGVLVGTDTGGSTTTGLCDGEYTNPITTVADREFRSGGGLWDWGSAGPSCVGVDGLGYAWWSFGSRLSATRSSGGEAAGSRRVEGLSKTRRGRSVPLVTHQVWQMDDVVLLSRSKRDLKVAMRSLERFMADDLGLRLKP